MGIQTKIKPELWAAIESSYLAGNYTHAIQDAMAFVTDIIRDKSGLDGDGDILVGKALGFGKDTRPKLMINSFQSQTEKDMQSGLMFTLKGMYALVRNPRAHERITDSIEIADKIILFIDYLTDFLGVSQQSFTVQGFLELVTDVHFVRDDEYINSLVDQIPTRKRVDTLVNLYRNRNWKQADNLELIVKKIIALLDETGKRDFIPVVSEDLQKFNNIGQVTLLVKLLPVEIWQNLDRMPRLRAENMLLDELKNAWHIPESGQTSSGGASWITRIAKIYIRKHNLRTVIIENLRAEDFDKHNFIANYFITFGTLPDIFETEYDISTCVKAIASTLRRGNKFVKDALYTWMSQKSPREWDEKILDELQDLTDQENPEFYLPDETPFLGKFEEKSNPVQVVNEEDIPF